MPEATQEVEINIYFSLEDLKEVFHMAEGTTRNFSFGTVTINKGKVTVTTEQEVTVEFDMSDYAPDYSWRD